jgi:ketosteroid isomerase-like protein
MSTTRGLLLAVPFLAAACSAQEINPAGVLTPDSAVNELLAADRAFAAAAPDTDVVSALTAMFTPDVIVPAGSVFVEGRDNAAEAIRSNPANTGARVSWSPVRGGISADGLHGFTLGYMTAIQPDSSETFYKYLAYWVKRPEGWRVQAFKRGGSNAVHDSTFAPALPTQMSAPTTDTAVIEEYRRGLAETETFFSRAAQTIGIGAAFLQYGADDAVNMGAPTGPFLVGKTAIAAGVGQNQTGTSSPVSWAPDYRVIVASSGDLGVTFGFIRRNPPADTTAPPFAFFTIWRRLSIADPWRYVAE